MFKWKKYNYTSTMINHLSVMYVITMKSMFFKLVKGNMIESVCGHESAVSRWID